MLCSSRVERQGLVPLPLHSNSDSFCLVGLSMRSLLTNLPLPRLGIDIKNGPSQPCPQPRLCHYCYLVNEFVSRAKIGRGPLGHSVSHRNGLDVVWVIELGADCKPRKS